MYSTTFKTATVVIATDYTNEYVDSSNTINLQFNHPEVCYANANVCHTCPFSKTIDCSEAAYTHLTTHNPEFFL